MHRNKLVAASLDASDGVEVVFSIGSRTVVETISMQEGINDRLLCEPSVEVNGLASFERRAT